MKKLSNRTIIAISIFLILSLVTIGVSRPIYKKLEEAVTQYTVKFKKLVKDYTGLDFKYNSFSPSIFSAFYIKGVEFNDESEEPVLSVKKIKISYKLKNLFKGDYENFVRSVSINATKIDVEKVLNVVQTISEKLPQTENSSEFDISSLFDYVPQSVSIRNTSVVYNERHVNAEAQIKQINLNNSRQKGSIEFNLKGSGSIFVKQNRMTFKGKINSNGTFLNTIDNSSLVVKLSDVTNGEFKMNRLSMLATYNDKKIEAHTVQSVNPYFVQLYYDIDSQKFDAEIKTDHLNPLQIIYPVSKKHMFNKFANSFLSVNAKYYYDIPENKMGYTSTGTVHIPEAIIPDGADVSYALNGNDHFINVSKFNVLGPSCQGNAELNFIFQTFKLSGFVNADTFTLPNKTVVSTEIYFDPLDKGFMAFSPQVFVGEKSLTALQLQFIPRFDSYDFNLEVSDYSMSDSVQPGEIKVDGSYMKASNYVQANVAMNSISIASVIQLVQQVTDEEISSKLNGVRNFSEPYLFTGDAYVSTDLKSVSYNIPYVLVANSKKDNQYLFLSVNGNEESIQLNRFDLIYGKQTISATASLDIMSDSHDMFFLVDIVASSIPYHFSGTIMSDIIAVSGDYGTDLQLQLSDGEMFGHLTIGALPFQFGDFGVITSMDCDFNYTKENGPEISLSRFEVEETDATSSTNPKLVVSGSGTKYGAQLNSITYTDLYSVLNGSADIMININEGIFDSAGMKMLIKNTLTDETITMDANVSNPGHKQLDSQTMLDSLYIDALLDIRHFSINRFTNVHNANNELTATLNLTGTLEHPYAALNIEKFTTLVSNSLLTTTGSVLLEDKTLSINNIQLHHSSFEIKDIEGVVSLESMTGKVNAQLEITNDLSEKLFEIPLTLKIYDSVKKEGELIPESTMITLRADKVTGKFMKQNPGFDVSAVCTKELISIFTSDNIGLVGSYIPSNGEVLASLNSKDIVTADITGKIKNNKVDLRLMNLNVNLPKVMAVFYLDEQFLLESGYLKGYLNMSGNFDTPEFKGVLSIANPRFYLPTVFKHPVSTDKMMIIATNNEITLRDDVYKIKNVPKFRMDGKVFLNKWSIDNVEASFVTLENEALPLKFTSQYVNVSGDVTCDLRISGERHSWDIVGKVFGDELSVVSNLSDIAVARGGAPIQDKDMGIYVRSDLDVTLGTHVMLNFNPFIRCIFVPNTHIKVNVDTEAQQYSIDGLLKLKSGDVSWLNRNFYIKQGSIKFNGQEIANPQISLRAETREKDENGESIQIILIAENQYLLDFNPRFSSIPAKSEKEISALLGQILVGDSSSIGDMVVTTGDYLLQSFVFRGLENKLRDFMNFDIFSVRTNVLQNTVNMSSSGLFSKDNISIGNFLDNSTVYIGKYFGSALYVDAMVHFSFENGDVNDPTKAQGFQLKPEFGLELELPIANIRWNMAPDITALMNNEYVPSSSVSLSWNFSF